MMKKGNNLPGKQTFDVLILRFSERLRISL